MTWKKLLWNDDVVVVRKNSGANIGTRPRLNFIEGSNITLAISDDAGGDEIDISISASSGGGEFVSGDEFIIGVIPALLYSPQTHTGTTHTTLKCVDNTTDFEFTMHRTEGTGTPFVLPTGWTRKGRLAAIFRTSVNASQTYVELYNVSTTFAVASLVCICASDTQPVRSTLFNIPPSSYHLTYRHWAKVGTTQVTTLAAWIEIFAVKD